MIDPRDLLVTGIPRSGTSLLVCMLNQLPGYVAINEPSLRNGGWSDDPLTYLAAVHQRARLDLGSGKAVRHKPTDDTFVDRLPRPWRPTEPPQPNFSLATKHTLEYLEVLPTLAPTVTRPIVAMVRNPADTIDAWVRSFRHLGQARPRLSAPARLSTAQRDNLAKVNNARTLQERRAHLWVFCAASIVEQREYLRVCRYEDLCATPVASIAQLLDLSATEVQGGNSGDRLSALLRPPRVCTLKPQERQTIETLCGPTAAALGYTTPQPNHRGVR